MLSSYLLVGHVNLFSTVETKVKKEIRKYQSWNFINPKKIGEVVSEPKIQREKYLKTHKGRRKKEEEDAFKHILWNCELTEAVSGSGHGQPFSQPHRWWFPQDRSCKYNLSLSFYLSSHCFIFDFLNGFYRLELQNLLWKTLTKPSTKVKLLKPNKKAWLSGGSVFSFFCSYDLWCWSCG